MTKPARKQHIEPGDDLRRDAATIARIAYKRMDHAMRGRILEMRATEPPTPVPVIAHALRMSRSRVYTLIGEMKASGYQPPQAD